MRSAPTIFLLLAAATVVSLSGCISGPHHPGPLPPAYSCSGYPAYGHADHAVGGYGGFSECVDDGQYYTRRDLRRMRREERAQRHTRPIRHGRHAGRRADSLHGLPVVAAYIVPMEMMSGSQGMCGGWECCEPMCADGFCCEGMPCGEGIPCGEGFPCGDCGPCGAMGCEIGGYPDAMMDGHPHGMMEGHPDGMGWQSAPSEAYPPSYSPDPGGYDGQMLSPVPVPPAEEGPWNPPATDPSSPLTQPEPEAQRPMESATWLPARLP